MPVSRLRQAGPRRILSVRIPEEIHEQITELAEQEERSVNWILVDALRQYLDSHQSEGDT
jgi:predicted transcriptional regulator